MFYQFSNQIITASILVSSVVLTSCGSSNSETETTNSSPVAVADNYSVYKGEILAVGGSASNSLLANDSDPDGDLLTVDLVSDGDVSFGVLNLKPDGSFSYTHDGSENLSDSFSYTAFDGELSSNEVVVSISVSVINTPPVANADAYGDFGKGGTLTVAKDSGVLLNDSDPENNTLTATRVSDVSFGTLTLNSDGSFSYIHDGSSNLTDSFTYQASDGELSSNSVTVSISAFAVNRPPVASAGSYSGVDEGGTLTVAVADGVLINDSDPESNPGSNALTAVLVNDVSSGALSLNPDGSFSYTHDGTENLSDSFTYQTFDGELRSNQVTVSIAISAVNDAPVANGDTYSGVEEGGTLTVNLAKGVLTNDTDPESDTLTAAVVSDVNSGNLSLNSDGSFSYTHDDSETSSDSFTYKASDGSLSSNTVTVSIEITAVNDAPVASADSYGGIFAGQTLTVSLANGVLDNDSDPENDAFTAVLVSDVSFGNLNLSQDGSFSYTHNGSGNLDDSFTYRASDGDLNSSDVTVSISISGPNLSPVASSSCSTTAQKSAKKGKLKATDADDALLTFSLGADGSAGTGPVITARGSVEITNPTTGAYTYTPSATGPRGTYSFKFFVEDPNGGTDTATETIIVDQTIMPLGDSITRGTGYTINNKKVGYRKLLNDSLKKAGYSFDFVGSDSEGKGIANFDYDNEGHSGWKAIEIAFGGKGSHANNPSGAIRDWLNKNPADIILLHIGTNDGPVAGTENDTEAILNKIDSWENSSKGNPVTVILAKIVNQDMSYTKSIDVSNYNAAMVAMALARITDDIVIVDMEAPLSYPADLADRVHPNKNGYKKMAPVWHTKLTSLLDKCP